MIDDAALSSSHTRVTMTRVGHVRWVICALLFFGTTINYIDRQVLGILAPDLQHEIGWSELDYGGSSSRSSSPMRSMMLAWGRILDKIGIKLGFAHCRDLVVACRDGHRVRALRDAVRLRAIPARRRRSREISRPRSKRSRNGFRRANAHSRPESSTPAPTLVPWSLRSWCR